MTLASTAGTACLGTRAVCKGLARHSSRLVLEAQLTAGARAGAAVRRRTSPSSAAAGRPLGWRITLFLRKRVGGVAAAIQAMQPRRNASRAAARHPQAESSESDAAGTSLGSTLTWPGLITATQRGCWPVATAAQTNLSAGSPAPPVWRQHAYPDSEHMAQGRSVAHTAAVDRPSVNTRGV